MFIEVVQSQILLIDVNHSDYVGTINQFVFDLHRFLLLHQLFHIRKTLYVLHCDYSFDVSGPLLERVDMILNLKDCLDHILSLKNQKLLLSFQSCRMPFIHYL
jgi:hypothetical protein